MIDSLPPIPRIFDEIKEKGSVDFHEMFQVFNMGVGFCVIVPPEETLRALEVMNGISKGSQKIGKVYKGNREVSIESHNLVSKNGQFISC